ncbi:MAG: nucleotidyltransferase domain-containing protein [Limnothrix sp.]
MMKQKYDLLCRNHNEQLESLCIKWEMREFAVFGSVLRDDFKEDSDIDCLIEFSDTANWDLFDIIELKRQLSKIFEREVDVVEKGSVSNPFILKSIMDNHQVLYSSYG